MGPPQAFNAVLILLITSVLVAAQQTRGTLRGVITDESPNFGESLGLAGSFGGFAGDGSTAAGNRRIYGQVRLNF